MQYSRIFWLFENGAKLFGIFKSMSKYKKCTSCKFHYEYKSEKYIVKSPGIMDPNHEVWFQEIWFFSYYFHQFSFDSLLVSLFILMISIINESVGSYEYFLFCNYYRNDLKFVPFKMEVNVGIRNVFDQPNWVDWVET